MTEGKRGKRSKKQNEVNGDGRSGSPQNGEDEPDGETQAPEKKEVAAKVIPYCAKNNMRAVVSAISDPYN